MIAAAYMPDAGAAAPAAVIGKRDARHEAEQQRDARLPGRFRKRHAGRPPMDRSTSVPTMPTATTSIAATTEPATSAAQMSMVWL